MQLKNKYKQILLDIFSGVSLSGEVWAYGSRTKNTAHDGSDLDLVIVTNNRQKLPIDMLMELKEKIRESNIPILVDLFDWARLPEAFHKNIEASHEVLYRSDMPAVQEPNADKK
jgi:predicted nucleotidyltransferase